MDLPGRSEMAHIDPVETVRQSLRSGSEQTEIYTMKKQGWIRRVLAAVIAAATVAALPMTSEAAETSVTTSTWKKQDSNWYYYNEDGEIQTGWSQVGKKWYYFDEDGIMQTGWITEEGKKYYLRSNGVMKTGWLEDEGNWYFFQSNGSMKTGWKKLSGNWYFFRSNGTMLTGWKKYNGCWYYFDENGEMVVGSITLDGTTYVFDASGVYMDPAELGDEALSQWSEEDLTYMYRCVQSEAGDADFDGRTHVASVIMNRVYSPDFGDTPYKVVTAKNQFVYWRTSIDQMTIDAVNYVLTHGDTAQGALFFHCMSYREYFCGHKHIFTDAYGHHFY